MARAFAVDGDGQKFIADPDGPEAGVFVVMCRCVEPEFQTPLLKLGECSEGFGCDFAVFWPLNLLLEKAMDIDTINAYQRALNMNVNGVGAGTELGTPNHQPTGNVFEGLPPQGTAAQQPQDTTAQQPQGTAAQQPQDTTAQQPQDTAAQQPQGTAAQPQPNWGPLTRRELARLATAGLLSAMGGGGISAGVVTHFEPQLPIDPDAPYADPDIIGTATYLNQLRDYHQQHNTYQNVTLPGSIAGSTLLLGLAGVVAEACRLARERNLI